jgi:hypothetical protein
MSFDFAAITTDDNNERLAKYEFYNETFCPTLWAVCEQARMHVQIAEREGGARLALCQQFLKALSEQYVSAMLEMTDLARELYPEQPPGLVQ